MKFSRILIITFSFICTNNFANSLIGVYWNGSEEIFTSFDLETKTTEDISILQGVNTIAGVGSTLDATNGRYIIGTNLGITVIDCTTGVILNNLDFPLINSFNSISYYEPTNKLYGVYWNGSEEIFSSFDLGTGITEDISVLTGVNLILGIGNTIDQSNGRYIIGTNLGITIIDINSGNIIETLPFTLINSINSITYYEPTNKLYGVYWNGIEEIFVSFDLETGATENISVLPNVNLIVSGNTIDSSNGRYIIGTNLGITVIDIETGSILNNLDFPLLDSINTITYKQSEELSNTIPTVSEWGIIILSILILIIGIISFKPEIKSIPDYCL